MGNFAIIANSENVSSNWRLQVCFSFLLSHFDFCNQGNFSMPCKTVLVNYKLDGCNIILRSSQKVPTFYHWTMNRPVRRIESSRHITSICCSICLIAKIRCIGTVDYRTIVANATCTMCYNCTCRHGSDLLNTESVPAQLASI